MFKNIKDWWRGEFRNKESYGLLIRLPRYKRPWIRIKLSKLNKLYIKHKDHYDLIIGIVGILGFCYMIAA